MRVFLHGVRRIEMVDDGRPVRGFSIFFSFPSPGVDGEEVDRRFISDEVATSNAWSPRVGAPVMVEFTPKGKIASIANINEK